VLFRSQDLNVSRAIAEVVMLMIASFKWQSNGDALLLQPAIKI